MLGSQLFYARKEGPPYKKKKKVKNYYSGGYVSVVIFYLTIRKLEDNAIMSNYLPFRR